MVKVRDLLKFYGATNYRDDANSRHRMVMSVFPQYLGTYPRSKQRILYRFEKDATGARCLIRSSIPPANLNGVQTLEEKLSEDLDHVAFRITANPMIRTGKQEKPIKEQYDQEEWIEQKLSAALSQLEIVDQKTEVVKRDWTSGKSVLQLVQFDGIAKVDDRGALKNLLLEGVGRNKNYGAGLLTIRPLR